MSEVKYIISCRNPSKVLPDILYYCAAPSGLVHAKSQSDLVWDKDPTCAKVFVSVERCLLALDRLHSLGIHSVQVLEKLTIYEVVDSDSFAETITKQKIRDILNTIPDDDIDFLVKHADLDLTSVT